MPVTSSAKKKSSRKHSKGVDKAKGKKPFPPTLLLLPSSLMEVGRVSHIFVLKNAYTFCLSLQSLRELRNFGEKILHWFLERGNHWKHVLRSVSTNGKSHRT